jgi:hypothetical protein
MLPIVLVLVVVLVIDQAGIFENEDDDEDEGRLIGRGKWVMEIDREPCGGASFVKRKSPRLAHLRKVTYPRPR